jgi:hypothetical protein
MPVCCARAHPGEACCGRQRLDDRPAARRDPPGAWAVPVNARLSPGEIDAIPPTLRCWFGRVRPTRKGMHAMQVLDADSRRAGEVWRPLDVAGRGSAGRPRRGRGHHTPEHQGAWGVMPLTTTSRSSRRFRAAGRAAARRRHGVCGLQSVRALIRWRPPGSWPRRSPAVHVFRCPGHVAPARWHHRTGRA